MTKRKPRAVRGRLYTYAPTGGLLPATEVRLSDAGWKERDECVLLPAETHAQLVRTARQARALRRALEDCATGIHFSASDVRELALWLLKADDAARRPKRRTK